MIMDIDENINNKKALLSEEQIWFRFRIVDEES